MPAWRWRTRSPHAFERARPVIVLPGPGNNGGDGFVAARLLASAGCQVRLDPAWRTRARCRAMQPRWRGALSGRWRAGAARNSVRTASSSTRCSAPVLLGRSMAMAADAIAAINRSGAHVVAVDLPSGIQRRHRSRDGVRRSRLTQTVTFFRRKPGHLLLPGRLHCGRITVADIGIPSSVLDTIGPHLSVNDPAGLGTQLSRSRKPPVINTRAAMPVVLSGELPSTGAARLAARGALRAGAGLVTIASPTSALAVNAAANSCGDGARGGGRGGLADAAGRPADQCGRDGTGRRCRARNAGTRSRSALAGERAVVLDADALTSFGENPKELFTILSNHNLSTAILTPHAGEFVVLFSS